MKYLNVFLLSLFTFLFTLPSQAVAGEHGVILVYHHVSTSTPPSTSISPEKFRQHLQYLQQHHNVISLQEMTEKLQAGQPLPDNAVAITFDDGYDNILEQGHPLLQEFGFPYTVFINPPLIGARADQLTWDEVKQMRDAGVTFANHTLHHDHLLQKRNNETQSQWLKRVEQDIENAQSMLEQQLGDVPRWVAYPYGEYSHDLKTRIQALGYIGFAQHSGAVAAYSDFGALPRFAAAGIYANLDTLKVKLRSKAMPVTNMTRHDPYIPNEGSQPLQVLTINTDDLRMSQVNCFINGSHMQAERTSSTLLIKPPSPLKPGRTRINCTAPSIADPKRFYWYSQPWFVPTSSGEWLD